MAKPTRRLTDPQWVLRYALDNPKRAVMYGVTALTVVVIVTASLAIQAIPVWIGALAAGVAFLAIAREPLDRARLVWTAADRPTASAREGVVSVSGRVAPASDRRLTSELGGVDCLAYEYTETSSSQRSEAGTSKNTQTDQQVLPFYVDDGSGPVLVDGSTGTLSLHTDETDESGSTEYEEGILTEGDEVTVYGEVRQPDERELPDDPDCVVTTGPTFGDVIVTDRHGTRVFVGQAAYALGLVAVGASLVVGAIGVATGLVSL